MMKVMITNNGTNAVDVPAANLIPGSVDGSLAIPAGETREARFRVPPTNDDVRRAIESWAEIVGATVAIDFSPCDIAPPSSEPVPPSNLPDPNNPLGI